MERVVLTSAMVSTIRRAWFWSGVYISPHSEHPTMRRTRSGFSDCQSTIAIVLVVIIVCRKICNVWLRSRELSKRKASQSTSSPRRCWWCIRKPIHMLESRGFESTQPPVSVDSFFMDEVFRSHCWTSNLSIVDEGYLRRVLQRPPIWCPWSTRSIDEVVIGDSSGLMCYNTSSARC